MTKFNIVAGAMVAAVFAISGVYAINTIVGHTHVALPRVLMIGSAAGDHWQRTLVGAALPPRNLALNWKPNCRLPVKQWNNNRS